MLAELLLPIGRDEALLRDFVDVVGERERHDISFETVDHRAGLFAGAAMRLLESVTVSSLCSLCHLAANALLNSTYSSRVGS